MADAGLYTIPVALTFDGVGAQVETQLNRAIDGRRIGQELGRDLAQGVRASQSDVDRALDGYRDAYQDAARSTQTLRDAEQQLATERSQTNRDMQRIVELSARVANARRDEERAQQQKKLEEAISGFDVVITTALVPGRPAVDIYFQLTAQQAQQKGGFAFAHAGLPAELVDLRADHHDPFRGSLQRGLRCVVGQGACAALSGAAADGGCPARDHRIAGHPRLLDPPEPELRPPPRWRRIRDRKSTRLNSSH